MTYSDSSGNIKGKILLILNLLAFILLAAFSLLHFLNEHSFFIKPLLILISSFAFFISIPGSTSRLNKVDLIFLLLIGIVSIHYFLFSRRDILPLVFLISIYFLYKFLASFLRTANIHKRQKFLPLVCSIIILSQIVLFFLQDHISFFRFFPNTSIFSILLASQLAFIAPFFLLIKNRNGVRRIVISVVLIAGIVALVMTDGRAGWMGLSASVLFICVLFKKLKRKVLLILVMGFIGLMTFLVVYKPGSSNGRLLIYKVIASEISLKELLTGIGYGQFKVKYNLLQSQYFSHNDINSKESQLADDTFFAFNDPLQLVVEIGLTGLVLLVLILYLFLRFIITNNEIIRSNPILSGACCSFISIITASFFSYPLQIPAILIQFAICISVIGHYGFTGIALLPRYKLLYKTIAGGLAVLIFACGLAHINYGIKSKDAFELSRSGFRNKAVEKFRQLNDDLIKDGNTLYQYANELSIINEPRQSIEILKQAANYYSTYELYKLIAQNEYELKNYKQAENKYKMAVYMVPNRMMSRYELMNFYIGIKDTTMTIYWAQSILAMPVKIPSQATSSIRRRTLKIVESLAVKNL